MQAGQYVHVLQPRTEGLLLPAVPVAGFDRTRGTIDLIVDRASARGRLDAVARLDPGDTISVVGPLGRGFEIDPRSRYLLVVADGSGIGRVRAIVDEATASGRQVTILFGAPSASGVFPTTGLRDEAEYVVATADGSLGARGSVTDLVPDYEAWADQCFAAGSSRLLERMQVLSRGRDARMGVARLGRRRARRGGTDHAVTRRRAWLQVALPHDDGCVLGVCLGCVVRGTRRPLRACREGPVVAADEVSWEAP